MPLVCIQFESKIYQKIFKTIKHIKTRYILKIFMNFEVKMC